MTKIDLIAGFLGAGKTTFIRGYAKFLRTRGERFALIENEFGAAGVDAMLLQSEQDIEIEEISGGCICCTQKIGFYERLLRLCPQVDRVLVEPSGVFSCADFLDVALSPQIQEIARIGMMIAIVDPLALPDMDAQELGVLLSGMRGAGALVLSRTQSCAPARIDEAVRLLAVLLDEDEARVRKRVYAQPWERYTQATYEELMRRTHLPADEPCARDDHSRLFMSATIHPERPYADRDRVRRLVDALMGGDCGRVLRVKGALCAPRGAYLVNCTPGSAAIGESGAIHRPVLNIIGRDLDPKAIRRALG